MEKYKFCLSNELKELIKLNVIQVKVYEDNGATSPIPFVEIQTDLEKTDIDFTEYVETFNTIKEANNCAIEVAEYLGVKSITVQ